MEKGKPKYGARVYFPDDNTMQVKQTVLRGNRYVIDSDTNGAHKEEFACAGSKQAGRVLRILEAAREGKLRGSGGAS